MRRAILLLTLVACAHRGPVESPSEELASLQQRIAILKASSQQELAPDSDRCRKQGAVANEICHCAERICVLSEDPAQKACTQAREDCRQARFNAESCK